MVIHMNSKKHSPMKWIVNIILVLVVLGGLLWWQYPNILHHVIQPHVHKKIVEDSEKHASDYDKNKQNIDDLLSRNGIKVDGKKFSGDDAALEKKLKAMHQGQGAGGNGQNGQGAGKGGKGDNKAPHLTYDYGNVKPYDEMDWSTINPHYDKRLLTGHIRIPAIGVNLPILEGVSNTNLYAGAGTLKPGQRLGQGNYALASHHMPDEVSNFSQLGKLGKGNRVYMSDSKYVYEYKIQTVKQMPNRSGNVVQDVDGKRQVTLVTCTDIYATSRIVAQGDFVKKHSRHSSVAKKYFK